VHRFALALSSPAPNPELGGNPQGPCSDVVPGRSVPVSFTVQVPPSTLPTDAVYISTDKSGWNPLTYRMNRVDALHYSATIRFLSGTYLKFLFDRGSTQSFPRGQDNLEIAPFTLGVPAADAIAETKTIYHWGDETGTNTLPMPQTLPTPYNPAPFPNLPSPQPNPTR
jgi:hypothetical protein